MEQKEIKALISLLDDHDREVVLHVEEKLFSLGSAIIPALEDAWGSSFNPVLQRKIEDLIHDMQFSSLKERFGNWAKVENPDLLAGMCLIAKYQYPDLDQGKLVKEIEQLYYDIWVGFDDNLHPFDQVKMFNSIFFGKLKFRGNTKNFHAPANSMINNVIESRKGNPISLCVLYLLIAQKLKMPVYGVNLPNLFILTYKADNLQFYINAFNKGLIFTKADIKNYIAQLKLNESTEYYEPCSNWDIVARTLRNLAHAFEKLSDAEKASDIRQLLDIIAP